MFDRCSDEGRCLVSFDLDFADVLRFPPRRTSGVVVIRLPRKPDRELLRGLIMNVLTRVAENPVESRLWSVEPGRIRIHQAKEE